MCGPFCSRGVACGCVPCLYCSCMLLPAMLSVYYFASGTATKRFCELQCLSCEGCYMPCASLNTQLPGDACCWCAGGLFSMVGCTLSESDCVSSVPHLILIMGWHVLSRVLVFVHAACLCACLIWEWYLGFLVLIQELTRADAVCAPAATSIPHPDDIPHTTPHLPSTSDSKLKIRVPGGLGWWLCHFCARACCKR